MAPGHDKGTGLVRSDIGDGSLWQIEPHPLSCGYTHLVIKAKNKNTSLDLKRGYT